MKRTLLFPHDPRSWKPFQGPAKEPQFAPHQHASSIAESQTIGSRLKVTSLLGAMLITTLLTGRAQAQVTTGQFVPFRDFVRSVRSTDANQFLAHSPAVKVKEPGAVAEMRQHILTMYEGVNVSHSYVLGSQTFDCVPINQQPAVRALGLNSIAEAPGAIQGPAGANQSASAAKLSQLPPDKKTDDFGNALGCEDRTIPMSRISMEQLSRFNTLHEFLEKGPNGSGHAPEPGPANTVPPAPYDHKYAFAYQSVDNLGANTIINLWRPYIFTDIGEIFSLAQSWIIGASSAPVQTAEVGWQNYPGRTGTESSVLFIYWTADGYQGTGCYDLTCPGFVQVSNSVTFGAPFYPSSYSVSDGNQTELQVEYYLWQGNWWLNVAGTWVGYYPGSVYRGGQLSRSATLLEFGSESVGSTVWPAEGSGLFPGIGWSYDAYQRSIYYIDTSNNSYWTSISAVRPSPSCYSITDPAYDYYWGIYFYFGGPGGSSCE